MDPSGGLLTADVVAWAAARVDFPVEQGAALPDLPDRCAVIARAGGPGLRYEGAYDGLVFAVQVRGASSDPAQIDYRDAERMAWQLDAVLLGAEMPTIGGVLTLGFSRSGSPPTPDEDAGSRAVMSTNYAVLAASVLD